MEPQKIYQKGEAICRPDARKIILEFVARLEKEWREAGLACQGFRTTRQHLINELMHEVDKIHPMTDC